jgi:hypothetical protein
VAAPQTPFLRNSVNAVPGAGDASVHFAAKIGNATVIEAKAAARSKLVGRGDLPNERRLHADNATGQALTHGERSPTA